MQALAAMAAHEGPSCFFNFSSGSLGSSNQQHEMLPSGIVCSASLGGGGGPNNVGASSSSSSSSSSAGCVRLPKAGYSFAAWVRLEDGREAAEQLQQPNHQAPQMLNDQSTAAIASDQALYALLHQQQQQQQHTGSHHQQLLQGLALAVRHVNAGSAGSGQTQMQLVAHCWAPKHAEAALPLQQPLVAGRWHHIALTHFAGGTLSQPELRLYLGGQLQVSTLAGCCVLAIFCSLQLSLSLCITAAAALLQHAAADRPAPLVCCRPAPACATHPSGSL
jgi:hypothetical protein